jgi:uncharacterized membrane protein YoaK (UPF0700 family)
MPRQLGNSWPVKRAIPLICLLCAVAGSVDASAYLLSGRVFVANMTGNTVLLAISLLQRTLGEAALRGGLVAAFLVGVVVARLLARIAGEAPTKAQRISVLGIESVVLLMLAWKNAGAHTDFLLLLLACILGVQNGAFRDIGGFHLNTTFITGDLEMLGEAIMAWRSPDSRNSDSRNSDSRNSRAKVSAFVLSWVGYAGGASLGALGAVEFPHHGFLPSMVLAVASTLAVALTPESSSDQAVSRG